MNYNEVVVKVTTEEDFDLIVYIAKKEGYKAPNTLEYNLYRESSCLHFTKGYLIACSEDWMNYNGYEVYSYDSFIDLVFEIQDEEVLDKILPSQETIKSEVLPSQENITKEVSSGGSSNYYKLTIHNPESGATIACETEDVISALVGDNFALGNVVKALRRIYMDSQGGGKVGIDMAYDINKCKYFLDSFQRRYGDKEK